VFIRNLKYLTRNRKAFAAIVFNSLIISLMIMSVFWKIGTFPDLLGMIGMPPTPEGIAAATAAYAVYI